MKKRIYIAGPINGIVDPESAFNTAEKCLAAWGYEPVNPMKIGNGEHTVSECWLTVLERDLPTRYPAMEDTGLHTWECYMRYDIRELVMCDGVAMLDSWSMSAGATLEHNTARALEIPVLPVLSWFSRATDPAWQE